MNRYSYVKYQTLNTKKCIFPPPQGPIDIQRIYHPFEKIKLSSKKCKYYRQCSLTQIHSLLETNKEI